MFTPRHITMAFGTGVVFCLVGVALIAATTGFQGSISIPQVLSYHGTLTDHNGVPLQGTKTMTFRLYDTAEGGAPLWEETRGVSLQDGRFQVLLGTVVSFPGNLWANAPLYLGVQMAGSDELLPRQLVASVVHAITAGEANVAEDANALNGRLASSFADAGHTHAGDDIISRVAQAQDSDTVDGQHASAFAASSHNHGGGDITSAVAQATNASNADTVDGIHASSAPTANRLLAMDGRGKLPPAALTTYDSGWFAVKPPGAPGSGTSYVLNHNLGTDRILVFLYYATDTSGSEMQPVTWVDVYSGAEGKVQDITPTTLTVYRGDQGAVCYGFSSGGWEKYYNSGYYRVIAIALG